MSTALRAAGQTCLEQAASLLSQQVWCWGRDIMRPEGNWLLEVGFERIEPPIDRMECSSVYKLELPHGRCVVLRGFGVFYGDPDQGGVFLPRYEFQPRYTKQAKLGRPPWTKEDLPRLRRPAQSQRRACAALVSDLIDWIWRYEAHIIDQLGAEYRRATLTQWDNGSRPVVPAENITTAWRELSFRIASSFNSFQRRSQFARVRRASGLKPGPGNNSLTRILRRTA